MFTPRTFRILILTALAVVLAAIPVLGQMDWRKLSPGTSPAARKDHAMAYDAIRYKVVLHGGCCVYGDTWVWDGKTWTDCRKWDLGDRWGHAMAYDALRQRIVVSCGQGHVKVVNDTWEWDGNTWTRQTPPTSPPDRAYHAMAYDAARQRVILFGGRGGSPSFPYLNDTWKWDGKTWTQCGVVTGPSNRAHHAMAYDVARKRLVLFGGEYSAGLLNDTWEWDGNTWSRCTPTSSPTVRYRHAMAFDAARHRIVLFGGSGVAGVLGDTWEWDGRTWMQRMTTASPPARSLHNMTYDSACGAVVLFGGTDGSKDLRDTWEYAPRDLTASARFISVSTGGNIKMFLDAGTTHKGKFYIVLGTMSGTVPGLKHGSLELLLFPDDYFMFTFLSPNTLIANSLGTLDLSGQATATVQVPKGLPTALIGLRFYHAYIVFKTSIDYASTPVPLTFGP